MDFGFDIYSLAQFAGEILDGVGVLVIVFGIIAAVAILVAGFFRDGGEKRVYSTFRRNIGRSVLLGLEFLVAGDVIRTVAGDPTFDSVIVLAVIVVIRTFLAFEFEMEISGKWPWQRRSKESG